MSDRLTSRSIRLSEEEIRELSLICETETLSESALMRRWVQEGIYVYKLRKAVQLYQKAGYSLGQAEYDLMSELDRRGIAVVRSWDQLDQGVATLADIFGNAELASAYEEAKRQTETRRLGNAS